MRLQDLPSLSIVELHPVVLAILDFSSALQGLGEELAKVIIVGSVLEAQVANVAQILVELLCELLVMMCMLDCDVRTRKAIAQILDGSGLLLFANLLVLLLVRSSFEALPW